ncbi:allantoicase [Longimicrobium sp.]|uniref:allantoicase n=1 Tax=Longimicrobium sp. TaxID=2029185 RepID=UPI002CFCF617|nr:allantoicase [Longimicrobium sp.]HSU15360.1 allantoicase [Longimicrobium sp.]
MTDFTEMVDLASERLGAAVVAANDEFFAPKEAMLKQAEPEWREDAYTERGKWMDGWETRRRRDDDGHDWAIVRLGVPGVVRGVVVDTRWFRGNYPEHCSVDGCALPGIPSPEELEAAEWVELLPKSELEGNAPNLFELVRSPRVTHLRLNIFPDGGVARFRAHGVAQPQLTAFVLRGGEIDLAAMENGGWVEEVSDRFYGHPQNLILPGRSLFMGDGWETQRRRGPGHDWSIVRLAAPGTIHRVEIDTDHFKGNVPDRCMLEGIHASGVREAGNLAEATGWRPILPETKLQPHARHRWEAEVADAGPVTHVRLSIFPDGGVARLRVFGTLERPSS